MTRRKGKLKGDSAFENLFSDMGLSDGQDDTSSGAVLPETTIVTNMPTTGAGPLTAMSLSDIRPDPGQPRHRLLPHNLVAKLLSGVDPSEIVQQWKNLGDSAIVSIAELANTIEEYGLIQPITVRENPSGSGYLIVTGERRYWAHILLTTEERVPKDQEVGTILANLVDLPDNAIRTIQLIENLQREGLTIVETALALREVYNQAQTFGQRVPWSVVERMVGITESYRKKIMQVTNLSEPALDLVHKHNLPEGAIRPVVKDLSDFPDLQMVALEQLVAARENGEYSASRFEAYVTGLVASAQNGGEAAPQPKPDAAAVWFTGFSKKTGSIVSMLQRASDDADLKESLRQNEEVQEQLRTLRSMVDELMSF